MTAARDQELYGFLERLDGGRGLTIVGMDEVGRGPLAGPLVVAAVVLPLKPRISGLNDSKKLSEKRREVLAAQIREIAYSYSIFEVSAPEVDRLGISAAVRLAFAGALEAVCTELGEPDAVLIDGRPLGLHAREQAIVKGDGKVAAIAAASIIAKVHRDAYMVEQASAYPAYGWESNKGYGSAAHIEALRTYGLSPLHRRSFCSNILPI